MNKKELRMNIIAVVIYFIALIVAIVNCFKGSCASLSDLMILLVACANSIRITLIERKLWRKNDE